MDGQYPCTAHAILVRPSVQLSVCLHFGTRLGKHGIYTMPEFYPCAIRGQSKNRDQIQFDIVQFLFYCIILSFYLTLFAVFYANTFEFCTAWQGTAIEIEIALFKNECNSRKKIKRSLSPKIALQNLQNCDKKGNNLSNVELNNGQVKYNVQRQLKIN